MLLTYNIYKLGYYVRMRSTHVVILVQVGGEVYRRGLPFTTISFQSPRRTAIWSVSWNSQ